MQENTIQDIGTSTATIAAQDFLNIIPGHLKEALSTRFLSSLEGELQAELQAIIQSRLQWSMQTVNLELAEQQRLQDFKTAIPEPAQAEATPQLLIPTSRSQTKHRTPKLKKVIEPQKAAPLSPASDTVAMEETVVIPALILENSQNEPRPAVSLQEIQLDKVGLSEPELLSPRRRRSTLAASREDILKQYDLNLEDFGARDPEAKPRRRRRSAAAIS